MFKNSKRFLSAILTLMVAVTSSSIPVFADDTSSDTMTYDEAEKQADDKLYIQSDGSANVTFDDHKATTDTRFKTVGYNITFYDANGTQINVGPVSAAFDNQTGTSYVSGDGKKVCTTKKITSAAMQQAIMQSDSTGKLWKAYISGGVWKIKADGILVTTKDGWKTQSAYVKNNGQGQIEFMDADGNTFNADRTHVTGTLYANGEVQGCSGLMAQDIKKLDALFGEGFYKSHINKLAQNNLNDAAKAKAYQEYIEALEQAGILDGKPQQPLNVDVTETHTTWDNQSGTDGIARSSSSPYYATYNDSREYTDSSGYHEAFTDEAHRGDGVSSLIIPGGEKYINGFSTDTYWGSVKYGIHCAYNTWSFPYKYSFTRFRYGKTEKRIRYDSKGEPTYNKDGSVVTYDYRPIIEIKTMTGKTSVPIVRKAYYYYLADVNLYDYSNSTTYNDTFSDDSLAYNSSEQHITGSISPDNKGPVDSISGLTSNRPSYEIKINGTTYQGASGKVMTDFTPSDNAHVQWADVDNKEYDLGNVGNFYVNYDSSETADGGAQSAAYSRGYNIADEKVGNGNDVKTKLYGGGTADSYAKVTIDYLKLGYNGTVCMNGATKDVVFKGSTSNMDTNYDRNNWKQVPYLKDCVPTWISATDTETYETSPAFGKSQTQIPETQENGTYSTTVESNYKAIVAHSSSTDFGPNGNIKGSYTMNEPVTVQTPVISPVTLHEDNGKDTETSHETAAMDNGTVKTQLVDGVQDTSVDQMRLDGTYWFHFDEHQHLQTQGYRDSANGDNAWQETPNKYDKYTKAKEVHFPFDVVLYTHDESGNESAVYHKHTSDTSSPDYWIPLNSKKDWEWVKFYIPSWAKEGLYKGTDNIKYKVESKNVTSGHQGSSDTENNENKEDNVPDSDKYIATYEVNSQVSGWIYDFQMVGIDDSDTYNKDADEKKGWTYEPYAFCENKEEKRTGTKNRFGGDSRLADIANWVRYTLDGTLTDHWNKKDTVTVSAGASHKYTDMGEGKKGTKFAFSVRTMSNLWDDDSKIEIVPTYTWYDNDGQLPLSQKDKQIYIYYDDYTGKDEQLLVPYGSETDKGLVQKVQFSDGKFVGSWYDKDFDRSALYPQAHYDGNGDISGFTNKRSDQDTARSEYLAKYTPCYTCSQISIPSGLRIFSGNVEQLKMNAKNAGSDLISLASFSNFPNAVTAKSGVFDNSMQTWYGEYYVPANLYVSTMDPDELQKYAEEHGGLENNDTKVWKTDGFLVVNFDIVTVKNGKENLRYAGGTGGQNMWVDQNYRNTAEVIDPKHTTTIPTKPGDVILINNSKSTNDDYHAEIWTIN